MTNDVNIMIDLETLGTVAGYTILSIGACTFDRTSTFEINISQRSSKIEGFKESLDTLAWWDTQDSEVRKKALGGVVPIRVALEEFNEWLKATAISRGVTMEQVFPWGNGADMDIAMLEAAYDIVNSDPLLEEYEKIPYPFAYPNVRCFRTLKSLFREEYEEAKNEIPFEGQKHTALADAMWQAEVAERILKCISK